ncbi:hypothetical protein M011DRAFT_481125 [Sporormia fimetaria CBS 119925]|uniref:Velvet domain-containing protein n=1 Tax=Sporormia fimetaria CBS 119925 TaxID=1340428 RepID=A0A6A6UZ25_9PLEO|nr:hypothetical protein M011DRAFT_481125 [Sporormia fimetaria CBS 119925]
MATIIQVQNETISTASRVTREGKKITYTLQVIQQPERARACGSGAKSSADRRPVDPPPIVELRVYEEGDGTEPPKDITFSYHANFFLFATLENARNIAPGRAPAATPSSPVLTGTPVSGMAYLDRPAPAGYFIFPDLSVRHEGKYRLNFALFEELKNPKDEDPEDHPTLVGHSRTGMEAYLTHRLEVRTAPFIVFSAKKFPGLAESTALSRTVQEQGCRVRIRRDVRMRRRETKGSNDHEDEAFDAARRTATPDNTYGHTALPGPVDSINRPRSVSNASNASFGAPRRPSMDGMAQNYQANNNNYSSMAPPTTGYPQMSQYGSAQASYQGQFTPPVQATAPMMQPTQNPYSQQSHHVPNSYPAQNHMSMNQSYGYPSGQSYEQPHYDQPAPVRQEPAMDYNQSVPDFRRPSVPQGAQQYPGPNQMAVPYSAPMDQYNRPPPLTQQPPPLPNTTHNAAPPSSAASIHIPATHSLAPLKTLQPPAPIDRHDPVSPTYQSPPYQSPPNTLSPPMSATTDSAHNHGYMVSNRAPVSKFAPPVQPPSTLGKRAYSSTFDTSHLNQRLQQGARPNPSVPGYSYDNKYEVDMEEPMDRAAMSYRRADGTHRQRRIPELGL